MGKGTVELLKKSMCGAKDEAIVNETGKSISEIGVTSCGAVQDPFFHNHKKKTWVLTHGDDFVVTGSKESLVEPKKRLESVYPIRASIIGAGYAKSFKALNRRIRWGETGTVYQHDSRLDESLGLGIGNTVQTPRVDDVKDENPEKISKYRSHVAKCLFFSQDRADITFAVNELCQRMSDPSQHSFTN